MLFDTESPRMWGWVDLVDAVIIYSNVRHVEHVFAGGKFLKRDFRLLEKEYEGLKWKFLKSAKKVQEIWKDRS